ncbi:3' 5'-cyclic adenosine monophosphate phosphodiesterase CpdA [termite gut metagenome]|uniref:3' 5'-cyclic adenosine monophosphate phosphodiesterase CpdA n=1 Tax=termite gut metagenome TaxID=433724 RepID=A0A5J4QSM1_9ZZZZ
MFAIVLGLHFYVFYRLWCMMPVSTIMWRTLFIVSAVIVVSSFFLSALIGNNLPSSVTSIMYRVGTSWFFIFVYLLILFLLLDLLRLTHLFPIHRFMYGSWIGFGVLAGFLTVVMSLGYFKYINKEKVELSLEINKDVAVSSLKIVAISDLHLGYGIHKKEFEQWVQLINKENPDIVLIAGDVIDNHPRPLYEQNMAQAFKQLKTKYGVYAVLGNHEYISGVSKSIDFLKEAGIIVLRDSIAFIDDTFYLIGRDDRTNKARKSIEELTDTLDKSKPFIMLDHQPYHLEEVEKNNIDLQISGHTHHGQILPISWITNRMYEKSHGYLKKGNSHIYVSSGIGIWGGKFRIGTQSEYIVINLNIKQNH